MLESFLQCDGQQGALVYMGMKFVDGVLSLRRTFEENVGWITELI